ncbi:DNA excision repair protein ERCC-5 isoform X2 [Toxorhynchites rutilus septentrionalis]|uniref:DNA excision repair protein ERCC-5 isoform X2 n=1 Tax=Toxorhynchites rutilus septentrionalis TaxID=329112 RepID=UPI00247ABC7D|nr:DNA excision repair protein ERCC-5 isoform X2 [Toxorhynchites rutilus septentrionalis]
MGVTGLWKLVEQSGKPVPLETLENKVLAVDISIWLHQVIKGFQDSKGSSLPNAHVLGLFHRLCKLLYYRIKPVFVFDGGAPALKKQTIAKRNQSKSKYHNEADRIQQLLLETLAKEKVVQQALGSATNLLVSPSKKAGNNSKDPGEPDEMFKLPPLKEDSPFKKAESSDSDLNDSGSSWDEKSSRNYYHLNLNAIDVSSVHFKNLPADVRHDILTDIKETRKESSWGRLHELPVESNNFSSFQMKRLLKRRQVQVELEEAEKEMGGKCLSLAELESLLSEEGIDTSSSKAAQKIASDENTRFLLVRDVQKAIQNAKAREEAEKNAPKPPKLSKVEIKKSDSQEEAIEVLDDKDMDMELQLAIQMSLMQDQDPNAIIELESEEVRMSRQQKQTLGSAAMSLARSYMLEYGGMSSDDIQNLLHQTQDVDEGDVEQSFSQMFEYNQPVVEATKEPEEKKSQEVEIASEEKKPQEVEITSDTDSDSDFIDVPTDDLNESLPGVILPLNPNNHMKPLYSTVVDFTLEDLKLNKDSKKVVEVVIDERKLGTRDEEDIFADVFGPSNHSETLNVEPRSPANIISAKPLPNVKVKQSEAQDSVVPRSFGIKIKNVEDINAKLKEELERLKTAPLEFNLGDLTIPPTLGDKINESNCNSNTSKAADERDNIEKGPIITSVDKKSSKEKAKTEEPELIHDHIKNQLEQLKSANSVINLDDITLDNSLIVDSSDQSDKPIIIGSDAEDSDATVGYSPMKEVQKILSASEQVTKQTTDSTSDPLTPTKGTPEHLVVARTPGSDSKKSEPEDLPNVPKPFFVNKTPTSSGKKKFSCQEGSAGHSPTKVSKQLFPEPSTSKAPTNEDDAEQLITDMADALKDTATPLELKRMALSLAQEERELEKEKNRQSRLGTSITEQMQNDCMQLLKLFGVPFIVAPMEAEAQCAFLNQIELTDGTITDDSDIWLFGGKTVYKNFFNQQKLVLEFTIENMERLFQMDRKKLIQLALLVGSDYTTGINGVGAVTALEILASFPTTPVKEGETSEMMSLLSGLRKFRDWWNHGRNKSVGTRITLKSKLKNIEFSEGFPSAGVVEAYLYPTVDGSSDAFSWGYPDAGSLRDFAKQKFGWTQSKTDDILLPVLRRLDERKSQASIKDFFKVQSAVAHNQVKVSKRVQQAVNVMAGKVTVDENRTPKKRVTQKKKLTDSSVDQSGDVVPKKTRGRKKAGSSEPTEMMSNITKPDPSAPSTSLSNISSIISRINDQSAEKIDDNREKKRTIKPRIPDPNPVIPQRVQDETDMANRKQRAIELYKKSQSEGKGKRTRK